MTGKRLRSRAQVVVSNFIEYFALEKENGGPLISLNGTERRVADALGVTRRTVSKIKIRKETLGVVLSPTKSRPNRKAPKPKDLPELTDLCHVDVMNIVIFLTNYYKVTVISSDVRFWSRV
ncbi:hypothetical protein Zmor_014777 [Zophobas morio]|uniref:HTH psq-type domain-containing protein n=1 Tax=Zophobas morio TaxID=2755281 RepID=A0AA38MGN9_9CUCU|nr:hypothetical protein Zmor_014777 [Zophobas morio]